MTTHGGTTLSIGRNMTAVALEGGAVILFSLFPALIAHANIESPYFFAAAWRVGVLLGYGAFLLVGYRDLVFNWPVWQLIGKRTATWAMLFWVIAFFDIPLYAWSAGTIDVAVTALLYEIWPIMLIVLMGRLFRKERRYRKVGPPSYFAFFLAVVGVALVVTSQVGGLNRLGLLGNVSAVAVATGVALALGAAVLTALSGVGFRWSTNVAQELPAQLKHGRSSLEVFSVVAGSVVGCGLSVPAMILIGVGSGESFEYSPAVYGILGGPLITALPSILWRKAMLMTDNLGTTILMYLTPLLSLFWLLLLSLVGPVDLTLLAFGAVVIVAANISVYLESRHGGAASQRRRADEVIAEGESDTVEFKPALRMNLHKWRPDWRVETQILKTLAAFVNSEGGTLVVGVRDDRTPVGIHVDSFDSEDKMHLHLRNIVSSRMSPTAMAYFHAAFEDYEGVRIMTVRCSPAQEPVFLRAGKRPEEFYIRAGSTSTKLSLSECVEYIRGRFRRGPY